MKTRYIHDHVPRTLSICTVLFILNEVTGIKHNIQNESVLLVSSSMY